MSNPPGRPIPTGTVTFLFTDIEGSTKLWELYPRAMQAALARHDILLREEIEAHGGYVFKTVGDAFCAAFPTAPQALEAAIAAQRSLSSTDWFSTGITSALQVRMGLHTGAAEERDGDYFGPPLNRAARLMSAGHGGQILLSLATQQLVRDQVPPDVELRDLGEGGLKDLVRSEHVYQVVAPDLPADFPPLKSLDTRYVEPSDAGGRQLRQVRNPYKGLRAFQEKDTPDFFGREALTEQLLGRMSQTGNLARFLAVVGPSGSGKSSVVRAGLVPALKQGKIPGSDRWLVIEVLPSAHPFEELDAVLLSIDANPNPPATLLDVLRSDERGLVRAVKRVLPRDETVELVLVIDQFEEVFTLVEDEAERVSLLETLYTAVTDPRSRLSVIITLRADFYDRPLLYPNPGELVRQRTEVVLPLSAEELERAVVRPAQRVGVTLEVELVAAIVKDVGEQPGALPLLQYALTELFERRVGKQMTLDAYRESGGVLGALSRRADEIYEGLGVAEQGIARQVFLRFVTLGEGAEDTRRRVRTSELYSIGAERQQLDNLLEIFAQHRLLTFDRDPVSHEPTIEVAHEALIRTWGRLREWLDASRANLQVHRQLMSAANEWSASGKDPNFLATGARLAQFEALAQDVYSSKGVALNEEERSYLRASLEERERQEESGRERQRHELELAKERERAQRTAARRLRYLVAAMAIFLAVAIALSGFALNRSQAADEGAGQARSAAATAVANQNEANNQRQLAVRSEATAQANLTRSEAQRLASEANTLLQEGTDNELVALLSIRSIDTQYTPQGDASLSQAVNLLYPRQLIDTSHTDGINDVAISPDDSMIITASRDASARSWDVHTGQELRRFLGHYEALTSVDFSPDGRYMATASYDKTALLWDAHTTAEVRQFVGDSAVLTSVRFSPDGKYLLTAGANEAWLWDVENGSPLRKFTGHTDTIAAVAFSPDGKYALTASSDKTARLWDVQSGKELQRFSGHTAGLTSASFSPDGQTVLTGAIDGTVRLWDARTGKEVRRFEGISASFSPDGRSILVVDPQTENVLRLIDATTGMELRRFTGGLSFPPARFSRDGKYVVSASGRTVRVWDVSGLVGLPQFASHDGAIEGATYSPDGEYVLTAGADQTARLWDAGTGTELRTFAGHTDIVNWEAFSPDGRLAATASWDHTARLWDVQTGRELKRFVSSGPVPQVAFSPDGKYLLTSEGNRSGAVAHLWNVQTGEDVRDFPDDSGQNGVSFSRDGEYLLTAGGDETAKMWDVRTGKEIRQFSGHSDSVITAVFSPDGKYVLTTSFDKTARLWDAQTGAQIRIFTGHSDAVTGSEFSPDGKYIVTASQDKTVRIWNVQTGQETRRLVGHTAAVWSAEFSPDGKFVLTASDDGTARIWFAAYHDAVHYLCGKLLRDFTDDQFTDNERAQYGITGDAPTCPSH